MLAILHENAAWCAPLVEELALRHVPHRLIDLMSIERVDASLLEGCTRILNRMSPSYGKRRHARALGACKAVLRLAGALGIEVLGGLLTLELELSKHAQQLLCAQLELPTPRTLYGFDARALSKEASSGLDGGARALIVKPDCGGSGDRVRRVAKEKLSELDISGDELFLVQEQLQGPVYRYEFIRGQLVYVLRIESDGAEFNNCPADDCATGECRISRASDRFRVLYVTPHPELLPRLIDFARAAQSFTCGIEVMENAEGEPRVIDCNCLNTNYNRAAERRDGVKSAYALLAEQLME